MCIIYSSRFANEDRETVPDRKRESKRKAFEITKKFTKRQVLVGIAAIVACIAISTATGCSWGDNAVNEIKGNLIGNSFNIETYDNYGSKTMQTSGEKINLKGERIKTPTYTNDGAGYTYDLTSVLTVNIDGKQIQTCGDTLIFAETGLEKEMDFNTVDFIKSTTEGEISDNTLFAYAINQYKNLFGKSRIVVIKSQMGQPICAYSGEEVYCEIPEDLPKTTKLMIDGKALYIHRANYQIIDKALL